jgi:Tfp pilus assembly protein PilV
MHHLTLRTPSSGAHRQRGISLIEALIALLMLSLGLLAVGKLQSHLRLHADIARQQSLAVRLAQEDLERLRAFSVVGAASGVRAYADIATASVTADEATRFVVTRQIADVAGLRAKSALVNVGWTDASGATQNATLNTIISGSEPALSGALALPPSSTLVVGVRARSVHIPIAALDLGDGRSVFKPVATGGVALLFDNIRGDLIARCVAPASTVTAALTTADLIDCDTSRGLLLSGQVRFGIGEPVLAFSMSLVLNGGTYAKAPVCAVEAKTARNGEPYATYHCAVYPLASGVWSGRLDVAPSGWPIGLQATDWRVCRYSADGDSSGAIDRNAEHPASYSGVTAALTQQNFLILKGTQNCPLGSAVSVTGSAADVHTDLSTAPHQP